MQEVAVLEEIKNNLNFIKEKMIVIEISLNEIDADLHRELNPEYEKKLAKMEKEDKRVHFKSIEEFDKHFDI